MKPLVVSRYFMLASACIFTLLLSACSTEFSESVRKLTYPPDFNYTKSEDVRSEMHALAQQMLLLEGALDFAPDDASTDIQVSTEEKRMQVLNALEGMLSAASKLQEGDQGGNHPFLQDHLNDFVSKISKAKNAASLAEPNYYYAGKVSGGCTNCHAINR
jgi:hypothetical protein